MYDPTKPYKHRILKLIESTWRTPYVSVRRGIYPVFTKKFSDSEIQHTDGIGTKGGYHWRARTFRSAVIDALAMNLNDLALVGATPYVLQNHIVLPEDDHEAILKIVSTLSAECRKYKIAMTGGETSIHSDTEGMDISITVSGFVKKVRTNRCRPGDVLIGLRSNGLHSNGITLVRKVLGNMYLKDCTRPTAMYLDTVLRLLKKHDINGLMHITGGAFSKLKDILDGADARITFPARFKPQPIFRKIFEAGVPSAEMYRTLNCGIGFVLSAPQKDAVHILKVVPGALRIGEVKKGTGVVYIRSAFDGAEIVI
jgi:phosphoribosylformylglycinamidine cyclo-ligase